MKNSTNMLTMTSTIKPNKRTRRPAVPRYNFQIKRFDDPLFGISIRATAEENIEHLALKRLGYFVVSEAEVEK